MIIRSSFEEYRVMDSSPPLHPSALALRSFGLGKLDEASAQAVLAHLSDCSDCRDKVTSQSGDSFLGQLRAAHGGARGTPAPAEPLAGLARTPESRKEPPAAIVGLPQELANNPDYQILRELGCGGMGVVYLARDTLMDRKVVLKVVGAAYLNRPEMLERFVGEIRSAARLDHVNVVKAHAALQLGDLLVFVMEYVDGEDLHRIVRAKGALPVTNACYYAYQTALGLQHAHEREMVHRDIKPHNLMLTRGKRHLLKILDFGLAKATSEKQENRGLTGEGQMLGTPDYVAPEQSLDAANATIRADVYSLGCTLYYLLTGEPPFRGRTAFEVMQAHHIAEARRLEEARPDIPAALGDIVRKMMAKDPTDRYQMPREVAAALLPFVKGVRVTGARPRRASRPPGTPSAGRETIVPSDTSRIKVYGPDVLPPPRRQAPAVQHSQFGNLNDKDQPERCGINPAGGKERRKHTLALVVAAVILPSFLAGGMILVRVVTDTISRASTRIIRKPQPFSVPTHAGTPPPLDCTGPLGVSAEDVRQSQAAWAKYLGRGVEETVEIGDAKMTFVLVPPGKFLMGSPEDEGGRQPFGMDETQHMATLTEPFFIGKTEVTQKQYEALTGNNPSQFQGLPNNPVELVTWRDAQDYAERLTKKLGDCYLYRLPTEAEWEYACRGGNPPSQPFGLSAGRELSSRQANFDGKHRENGADKGPSLQTTCPVASYEANALGLFDMHGNVWEWCADWFGPYSRDAVTNPTGPVQGPAYVHRGGGWRDPVDHCRAAQRWFFSPECRNNHIGFRLARSIPPAKPATVTPGTGRPALVDPH
jgi:serine/threonine protein kinase/formylglycine-generating enzyme required for sulfatase activity